MTNKNIHPITDTMLSRADHERLLGQHAVMIWLTGLSGSGKSTLAVALERALYERDLLCRVLDGDNIRSGINKNLGFSEEDRLENIRRIAEVGRLFVESGVITIAAFISPTEQIRSLARKIVGEADFMEIYVSTPLDECERRDVKGLYQRARSGDIEEFTGVSQLFESPTNYTLEIDTTHLTVEESLEKILAVVLPRVELKR